MEVVRIKSKFLRNLFDQNTYVLKNGKSALIIDAGAEVDDVKEAAKGLKVEAILMTHLHFDHIWNIEKYLQEFDCKVYVCNGAEEKFFDSAKNASTIMRNTVVRNVSEDKINFYESKLQFADFDVEVLFTPGHSRDCVCLKIENKLFSGDTLFADGIGRTDLYDSDNEAMKNSLKTIKNINFDVFYPGHGDFGSKLQADKVIDYYL